MLFGSLGKGCFFAFSDAGATQGVSASGGADLQCRRQGDGRHADPAGRVRCRPPIGPGYFFGAHGFLAAQGFFAAHGFLAAQGFFAAHGFLAAQGFFAAHGFLAAQGLAAPA